MRASRLIVILSVAGAALIEALPARTAVTELRKTVLIETPFTDNHDGSVTDGYTGLVWQQVDSGPMTFEQASANAKTVRVGGHDDWRLPTEAELLSLTNHHYSPAIDRTIFPSHPTSPAEYWWSSQTVGEDRVWVVNRGGGTGAKRKNEAIGAGGTLSFNARYVRGERRDDQRRYVDHHDGTVTDRDSGLMWAQSPSPAIPWGDATHLPKSLSVGGHRDWRLPDVKELASLVNFSTLASAKPDRAVACIDRSVFPTVAADLYWTATPLQNTRVGGSWYVDLAGGNLRYDPNDTPHRVLVVRTDASVATSASGPHAYFHPEDPPVDQPPEPRNEKRSKEPGKGGKKSKEDNRPPRPE